MKVGTIWISVITLPRSACRDQNIMTFMDDKHRIGKTSKRVDYWRKSHYLALDGIIQVKRLVGAVGQLGSRVALGQRADILGSSKHAMVE